MNLAPGSRLGSYEIESMLGAGGMGEVYRARDTRLDRVVAIKVLPESFAADPERRQRFEREARVIASLSHPHVCAVHDVGSAQPVDSPRVEFLVMEYLDGQTLADRIARGPMPLDEIVRIGSQMAAALEAAHRQRIVHRDLKPSNVMLTRSGVKLLDFGLAKAFAGPGASGSVLTTVGVSAPGAVLGTVPYMAPEQIEGREADARSDIFALGAVLHEMATGRRAFPGDSPAAIAAAILSSDPPVIAVSASLDRIVRGCLQRDPEERWHSAQDVALQLRDVSERDRATSAAAPPSGFAMLPWAVAVAAAAIAIAAIGVAWRTGGPGGAAGISPAPLKFIVPMSQGDGYLAVGVELVPFAVSPDGSRIAYAGGVGDGEPSVWIRQLSAEAATMVPGTEGASSTFWSPDSRSIGFFAGGQLKRVELAGGAPVALCPVRENIGHTGTWGDGQIVFASVQGDQILRVAPSGGVPEEIVRANQAAGENRVSWPSFLPDGRRFLYLSVRGPDKGAVMLASPDGARRELLPIRSNAQYAAPGYLLYGQEGVLLARRMNPDSGQLSGEPVSLAAGVSQFPATAVIQFSASSSGALAFHAGVTLGRVTSVDRTGRERAEIRPAGAYQGIRLSRDGGTLYLDIHDAKSRLNIWKFELDRGVESRVTADTAAALDSVFGPDGSMIFSALRGSSAPSIILRSPSGSDEPLVPSLRDTGMQSDADLTADGRWMMYSQRTKRGTLDLVAVSMDDRRILPFHQSDADEAGGRFSPDGRWVAFVSNAGGRFDVYVAPFPGPGPARIVSVGPGTLPRWSVDGRELFYVGRDGTVYAVPFMAEPSLSTGRPQALFSRGARGSWQGYQPTRDGGFIALEPISYGSQSPLHVIVNWPTLVAR